MDSPLLVPELDHHHTAGPASAAKLVADAVTTAADKGTMGIVGVLRQNIMNMSAMAIIAMLFVWQFRDSAQMAREDRTMFRESLEKIEERQETRYLRTEATHQKTFEKMGVASERQTKAMEAATRALEKVANKEDYPERP